MRVFANVAGMSCLLFFPLSLLSCGDEAAPVSTTPGMPDSGTAEGGADAGGAQPDATADAGKQDGAADAGEPADTSISEGPTVTWQIPMDGQTVSGKLTEANCSVGVTSKQSIKRVDFLLDGAPLNTEKAAPYGCLWDTANATAGVHKLEAVAVDAVDATGSASIQVEVGGGGGGSGGGGGGSGGGGGGSGGGGASGGSGGSGGDPCLGGNGKHYYVNGSAGSDGIGTSTSPWKTMAKVNAKALAAGDVVHLSGTITDSYLTDQNNGTASAHVTIRGEPNTHAAIKGVQLQANSKHLDICYVDITGNWGTTPAGLRTCPPPDYSTGVKTMNDGTIDHITFRGLRIQRVFNGFSIGSKTAGTKHTNIWFHDTDIRYTAMDGGVLQDKAGDGFRFIGGSIRDTGYLAYHCTNFNYHAHGTYASGGHNHVWDGVAFSDNHNGCSISLRRGNSVVRNCDFPGFVGNSTDDYKSISGQAIGETEEDNAATGGKTIWIYNNVFHGTFNYAMYQGGCGDDGSKDANNTWKIWGNTLDADSNANFSGWGDGTCNKDSIGNFTNVYVCKNTGGSFKLNTHLEPGHIQVSTPTSNANCGPPPF